MWEEAAWDRLWCHSWKQVLVLRVAWAFVGTSQMNTKSIRKVTVKFQVGQDLHSLVSLLHFETCAQCCVSDWFHACLVMCICPRLCHACVRAVCDQLYCWTLPVIVYFGFDLCCLWIEDLVLKTSTVYECPASWIWLLTSRILTVRCCCPVGHPPDEVTRWLLLQWINAFSCEILKPRRKSGTFLQFSSIGCHFIYITPVNIWSRLRTLDI